MVTSIDETMIVISDCEKFWERASYFNPHPLFICSSTTQASYDLALCRSSSKLSIASLSARQIREMEVGAIHGKEKEAELRW